MSDPLIVRPRLAFEEQFGQHRNWWVRDARIAKTPISILLYLLSHDPQKMPTQSEAQQELKIGKSAWQNAKHRLMECGFLIEIRDRYPDDYVDSDGRHRGGQRRFRLFIQDPEPGAHVPEVEAVLDLDEPYETFIAAREASQYAKAARQEKPQITPTAGFQHTEENPPCADSQHTEKKQHTEENRQSFKEEKTRFGLVGSLENSDQPTNQTNRARESEIDTELAALHPDLRVTLEQIRVEVAGRVDLDAVDVVQAMRDTVLAAAAKGHRIENPARYAAAVIVRTPEKWPFGVSAPAPFAPMEDVRQESEFGSVGCAAGSHYWGPESWAEVDRAYCVTCGEARRNYDPVFASLEDDLAGFGGGR